MPSRTTDKEMHILVVEPRKLIREAVASMIGSSQAGLQVSAAASVANPAPEPAEVPSPVDAVVMVDDSTVDDLAGRIRRIASVYRNSPVLVIGCQSRPERARQALSAGAKGYVEPSAGWGVVAGAVRLVAEGGTYLPSTFLIKDQPDGTAAPAALPRGLTRRQYEIAQLLAQGLSNKEIAARLGTLESTVKTHVWRLMQRLNASNRTQVALIAARDFRNE